MKADRKKLEIAMANSCLNPEDLSKAANMPRPTLENVLKGKNVRPATLGLVARALGVNVTELIDE